MYHNLIYIVSKKLDNKTLYNFSIINSLYFNNSQERINLVKAIKIGWNKLAENGNIEFIKLLHKYNIQGCTYFAMGRAACDGHLDVIKWLHENRREGCTWAMDAAASNGHLDVVKWLHENRREGCTTQAMDEAAMRGH